LARRFARVDRVTSIFDIVSEARIAASRGWDKAWRSTMRAPAADSPQALARVIESEILPRLRAPHGDGHADPAVNRAAVPAGAAEQFAAAALTDEVRGLLDRVDALLAGGVPVETIYLDLLAPAARRLGAWWDSDSCDFFDVTMGLWRLQEVLQALSAFSPWSAPSGASARRALFAPAPGEQHGFGAALVEEFFRRAGWQTWNAPTTDAAGLQECVAARSYDIVGLTVSVERHLEMLAGTIAALRRASRNPDVIVMVGGRLFVADPGLAARVGADATAADAEAAVAVAERLLALRLRAGSVALAQRS
jgi:MerR family transcriptional regulator, light-induced transcriptional regulator